jgi:anti-sigma B factor antagonist
MAGLEPEPPTPEPPPETEPAMLEIDMRLDPAGAQVVVLSGELDSSNAATLQERVASIPPQPAAPLIFDLTGLRFMDSAGIAVLIGAAAKASSVSLRNPSPIIRRVLDATGLSNMFSIQS